MQISIIYEKLSLNFSWKVVALAIYDMSPHLRKMILNSFFIEPRAFVIESSHFFLASVDVPADIPKGAQ